MSTIEETMEMMSIEDSDMQCESDSEYEYEGSDEDMISEDENQSNQCGVPPLWIVDTSMLSPNMVQYQWSVLCLRFAATYIECSYNVVKDHLTVQFIVGDRILELSVADTTEPTETYPNAPPKVMWHGPRLMLDQQLLITANQLLVPTSWNICTDLNAFVYHALHIMHNEPNAADDLIKIDEVINKVVSTVGVSFRFETDKELPSFGVVVSNKKRCNYLSGKEKIAKAGSLAEMLQDPIKQIAEALNRLPQFMYMPILQAIVSNILSAKISKLEALQNEQYYRHLIMIAQHTEMDFNWLQELLDETSIKTDNDNDKVFFVETFDNHTFLDSNTTTNGKLIKRLYSELEALGSALEDIDCYICVSEANIHMIKMLMIPDYDTPYGGGYFEFDMLIPFDYPNMPPKVQFLTTGGRSVRFNPNLYKCGKVCLSVLNTWADNQWNPASSTLTQVVLSIFSMVFIDHPYTNEPCYYNALATKNGKAQSEAYNDRVRNDCARVAITEQLKNRSTPFKDIIEQHWQKNKQKTIDAYAKHEITISE